MALKRGLLSGWFGSLLSGLAKNGEASPQHVRMFVLSHLCGPFIGLALSAFLFLLGFPPDERLAGFAFLVCLFWGYPLALRWGVSYNLLCILSLQHLAFAILWASHSYGGLTSPFLLWLAIVPLLAFLYSAPHGRVWLLLLATLVINTGLFLIFSLLILEPQPVDPGVLRWLALLSLLSASAYVAMMASYFGRVLSSRNEIARDVAHRRATAAALEQRVIDLRHAHTAKLASLSRLARNCKRPVETILSNCPHEPSNDGRSAPQASELNSIRSAALRIRDLMTRIEMSGSKS